MSRFQLLYRPTDCEWVLRALIEAPTFTAALKQAATRIAARHEAPTASVDLDPKRGRVQLIHGEGRSFTGQFTLSAAGQQGPTTHGAWEQAA